MHSAIEPMPVNLKNCLFLLLLVSLLAGCSNGEDYDPTREWTARDFYEQATAAMNSAEFQTAIQYLETLEARFPFDPYAKQAQLDVAYSYYKFEEADTAISAVERFIRLHPRDPNIDYALYLKGLINYNRGRGLLEKWLPHDMSMHDASIMQNSFNDFALLVKRFPDSNYAGDAHQRMIYLRNKLAEKEIHAARYYIERQTWLGAANRAREIIEKYPRSIWRDEALQIMLQAYTAMGLDELAADTRRIIALNAPLAAPPAGDSFDEALAEPPSLIDRLFGS